MMFYYIIIIIIGKFDMYFIYLKYVPLKNILPCDLILCVTFLSF